MKDSHLTLNQKVGQLFVLGFTGPHPDADAQALLDAIQPGGLLLHQRNIENFEQIYELTNYLRETSLIPPLLAVDHEGGRVDRLKHIFSMMPSMAELAQAGIAHLRTGARIIAAELEATGFNLNFAPVADINRPGSIMSERCLSADPAEVARLASAFSEELSRRRILTSAKHFPGLGGAQVDPHFSLPRIDGTKRQLVLEDALPFVKLFERVDMVMVSHGSYRRPGRRETNSGFVVDPRRGRPAPEKTRLPRPDHHRRPHHGRDHQHRSDAGYLSPGI